MIHIDHAKQPTVCNSEYCTCDHWWDYLPLSPSLTAAPVACCFLQVLLAASSSVQ